MKKAVKKSIKSSKKVSHKTTQQHPHQESLDVLCPKCGAWAGKPCKNVDTGAVRRIPHNARIELASRQTDIGELQKERAPKPKKNPKEKLTEEQKHIVGMIQEKIEALGKHAEFVGPVTVGPIISTYRFFPLRRTKVAHLEAMAKDFAVALGSFTGAEAILVKRMPGESAVGVFVPNKNRKYIDFKDTIENVVAFLAKPTADGHLPIPLNFGEDSSGNPFVEDLSQLPHLLIAGTTGSGKSTELHAAVTSLAFAMTSKQLKLIISDTKGVEFKHFTGIPHLQFPIATSVYQTMEQLQWAIDETQRRLDRIGYKGVRNVHEFNQLMPDEEKMPYVVIVIDELADILGPQLGSGEAKLNAAKLSSVVARSRASGIHVIAGTQRPDVKMVAGSIKVNFPARLSFRLPSQIDSRTVLNTKGAEHLMSRGDMLYQSPLRGELERLHAPFTSIDDVKHAVQFIIGRELDSTPHSQEGGAPAGNAGATFRIQ